MYCKYYQCWVIVILVQLAMDFGRKNGKITATADVVGNTIIVYVRTVAVNYASLYSVS